MLNELTSNLRKQGIHEFRTINASAMALPLENTSLDVIVTFNAIHHFDPRGFLEEASRVLRENSSLFIYTRLRSQNRRNIWGRFFPGFHEKETRLYSLKALKDIVQSILALRLESTEYFTYERQATLESLTNQAIHHHYSTFALYRDGEFQEALLKFRENITRHFRNSDNVSWNDENVLFHVRKNRE
jgi:SAM-dependent methyltransferase